MGDSAATAARRRRMEQMADWVSDRARVADIGSDHGLLPQILIRLGKATHCIATEKNPSRLRSLREAWSGAAPSDLEFRHGDGLSALREADRIDLAVMAGMGARTILRILRDSPIPLPKGLILQPQTEPEAVRRWIRDSGWKMCDEDLIVERGQPYFLMHARQGPSDPRHWDLKGLQGDDMLHAGPCLVRQPSDRLRSYWLEQRERIASLSTGPGGKEKQGELARIERILAAFEAPAKD